MYVEINNEGYCENCETNNDCVSCNFMNIIFDEITINKKKIFSIINKKDNKNNKQNNEQNNEQNNPICFDCGKKMIKSKFKNGALYWCSCKRR